MLRDLFSLFPAHAGVIPLSSPVAALAASFPRTCGGDPRTTGNIVGGHHFSPHMRG